MSDARQPEVDFFPILGRDFDQMFRQIDSVREKIRRNTNLLASRHIKREKDSLPVDVCLPKTSLLKVARLDFFGLIPPKFEHQLRRHE